MLPAVAAAENYYLARGAYRCQGAGLLKQAPDYAPRQLKEMGCSQSLGVLDETVGDGTPSLITPLFVSPNGHYLYNCYALPTEQSGIAFDCQWSWVNEVRNAQGKKVTVEQLRADTQHIRFVPFDTLKKKGQP